MSTNSRIRFGKLYTNAAMVLRLVQLHPNCTANEIWSQCSDGVRVDLKEPQEIRRRLNDLKRRRLVKRVNHRKCNVKGTLMGTWKLATGASV